jgi:hypothetical protein
MFAKKAERGIWNNGHRSLTTTTTLGGQTTFPKPIGTRPFGRDHPPKTSRLQQRQTGDDTEDRRYRGPYCPTSNGSLHASSPGHIVLILAKLLHAICNHSTVFFQVLSERDKHFRVFHHIHLALSIDILDYLHKPSRGRPQRHMGIVKAERYGLLCRHPNELSL